MIAIVTDVHYRMSLALIRDLGQAGVEVLTCERESCRTSRVSPPWGPCPGDTARHVWLPEEGYLDALWELCREVGEEKGRKPALLPVGAATLGALAADRERFRQVCGLFVPTTEQLDLFNSKERVAALAASLDIPVPASYAREPGEDADAFARRLPCRRWSSRCAGRSWASARRSGTLWPGRRRRRRRPSAASWPWRGRTRWSRSTCPGRAWAARCWPETGRSSPLSATGRLREYPVAGGPSSCCRVEERPDLADMARAMVRAAGYNGLAMLSSRRTAGGSPGCWR